MQHTIIAPHDGFVADVFYAKGDMVIGGAKLLRFEVNDTQSNT